MEDGIIKNEHKIKIEETLDRDGKPVIRQSFCSFHKKITMQEANDLVAKLTAQMEENQTR